MRAKNNPKNKRALLDFQKRQLELSKLTEMDTKEERINSNIENGIFENFRG